MRALTLALSRTLRRAPKLCSLTAVPSAPLGGFARRRGRGLSTAVPGDHTSDASKPAPSAEEPGDTHFGNERVSFDEKREKVKQVFSTVSERYDVMNDLMSGGLHRVWKDCFVRELNPLPEMQILDVAGGTGDIAFRIVERMRQAEAAQDQTSTGACPVMVCDINEDMLAVGKKKAEDRGLDNSTIVFFQGDAENLPVDDESIDAYVISFGMRNVPNPAQALKEAMRVLKYGGRFMMLEFAKVNNPLLSQVYDKYSINVIPEIGHVVTSDRAAYKYLVESIRQFHGQEEFVELMKEAGFKEVTSTDMTFGVVAQYSGYKL